VSPQVEPQRFLTQEPGVRPFKEKFSGENGCLSAGLTLCDR